MHDGARDVESVMQARYWLTEKGWDASQPAPDLAVGDLVRVGRGKVEWTIKAFGIWPTSGEPYADLAAVEGYANTTATLDRLTLVTR
jgi:hypothetical protein